MDFLICNYWSINDLIVSYQISKGISIIFKPDNVRAKITVDVKLNRCNQCFKNQIGQVTESQFNRFNRGSIEFLYFLVLFIYI